MSPYTKVFREDNQMNDRATIVAGVLTTLGILFFVAMGLQILPMKYAIFAGVACFIVAGAARRLLRERA